MSVVKYEVIQKWKTKVSELAKETGYSFEFLWNIWIDMLMENDTAHKTEEEKWNYFKGVSYEQEW